MADFLITAAAFMANKGKLEVFNLCSSARNPMTWRLAKECVHEYWNTNPTQQKLGRCKVVFYKNASMYKMAKTGRQIPAYMYYKFA